MTPIRVRGRRYGNGKPQKSVSDRKLTSNKPGRPLKFSSSSSTLSATSDNSAAENGKRSKRRRISRRRRPHATTAGLSPRLEAMPNEVLSEIFKHCIEINLPRASLVLGKALGSPFIYEALTIQAFSDPGTHEHLGKYRATPYELDSVEKLELQKRVITCQWFSPKFLAHCAALYYGQALRCSWTDNGVILKAESQATFSRIMDSLESGDWEVFPRPGIRLQGTADDGEELQMQWESGSNESRATFGSAHPWNWEFPYIPESSNVTYVPESLCESSFTIAKLDKLRFLVDHNFRFGISHTELFNHAVGEAIASDSSEALRLFLKLGRGLWSSIGRRPTALFAPRGIDKAPLDARHWVSTAVFGKEDMLAQLLEYDDEGHSLPKDDTSITAWALEAQNKGSKTDRLAKQILKMMT